MTGSVGQVYASYSFKDNADVADDSDIKYTTDMNTNAFHRPHTEEYETGTLLSTNGYTIGI